MLLLPVEVLHISFRQYMQSQFEGAHRKKQKKQERDRETKGAKIQKPYGDCAKKVKLLKLKCDVDVKA